MEIYPSLISSDLLNLERTITALEPHCAGFHLDIMDDHFVPNLTWGPAFVNAIMKASAKPLHVHLMVDAPAEWMSRVSPRQDDIMIFHYEAISDKTVIPALLQEFKDLGCKVGIAINPETSVENVFEFCKHLDQVLLMSVHPGFSGQKFMPEVVGKVQLLIELREEQNLAFTIGMDGGIGKDNLKVLTEVGVNQVGIASAIFSQKNVIVALKELVQIASSD